MKKLITILALFAVMLCASAFADITESDVSQIYSSVSATSSTQVLNLLIAVSDNSNTTGTQIAIDIINKLGAIGYSISLGNIKLFSEVDAETIGTTYPYTIAIHDNLVVGIQGEGYGFEQAVYDAINSVLDAKAKIYSFYHYSSIYKSDLMVMIDEMMCPTTVNNYCSGNSAVIEYSYWEWENNECVSRGNSIGSNYCEYGCLDGYCLSQGDITREFRLYEGWNLLPIGDGIEIIDGVDQNDDAEEHLLAGYVWNPEDSEYYDMFTNEGQEVLEELVEEVGYTAIWIYLDQAYDLNIRIDADEVHDRLEEIEGQYEEGWNFLVWLPEMYQNYTLGHFNFYQDNVTNEVVIRDGKVWAWDIDSWESGAYDSDIVFNENYAELVGMPFLAYYTNEFTPYLLQSNQYSVPSFPY